MFVLSKKKEPLKLEAYASLGQLADLFPIVRSKESLPNWYHNISSLEGQKTVRQCPGVNNLFHKGVMIPAWADHEITIHPNGNTNVTSPASQQPTGSHRLVNDAPGAWPGYANIKFLNPWMFNISIKAGDILMQMIPVTEEPFELEIKLMTPQIWAEKFQQWPFSANFLYHKAISKIKKSIK